MALLSFEDLPVQHQQLLQAAAEVMTRAYNPHSGFYVGSAVLGSKGKIIVGVNVENSAFGSTICAERSALMGAYAAGMRDVTAIAIIVKKDQAIVGPSAPCGDCRQVIFELSQLADCDIEVIMSNTDMSVIWTKTISELLPLAFGPDDLRS